MRFKVLSLLAAGFFLPALLLGGQFTRVVSFQEADLVVSKVDGYDLVKLRAHPLLGEPGQPLLPRATLRSVIPPTAVITKVEVTSTALLELPGQYLIHPAQPPRPISSDEPVSFVGPDQRIYSSSAPYPGEITGKFHTGSMGGYRIGSIELYPLQYVPSEKTLRLYTRIELTISYEEGAVSPKPRTHNQRRIFSERVKSLVANPEDINIWAPSLRSRPAISPFLSPDTVEYVVITTSTYEPEFQQLVDWKTKKGVPGRIVRLSDISSYPGRDTPERIRNFIIDADSTWGTVWFLLGGDPSNSVVPTRLTTDFGFGPFSDLASDWYFADLDGNWDGNGNNIFGEMGDNLDLYCDVFVGRASVGSSAEAQSFVDKVLTYEKNAPTGYLKKELHSAEELWPGYGGWIVCDSIAAVTPGDYTIAKLYEYLGNLNAQAVLDSIDAGYQFVHFSAHGNTNVISTGPDAIYSNMVDDLANGDMVGIHAAISCIVGRLDYEDCIVEHFMNNLAGGTVAWLGNSRYGWGNPPDLFASELMDLRFFDYLFTYNLFHIANSHASAKDRHVAIALGSQLWRYCLYEWNLFGDPEMPVWTDTPAVLTVNYPNPIPAGPYDLTVGVYDGAAPVENALVCVMDTLELYVTGYTDPTGEVILGLVTPHPESLYITVTAHNFWPYEGYIWAESGAPYITHLRHEIDDALGGNGDGIVNPGESIELPMWVKNWGDQAADGVTGVLATSDAFITAMSDTLKAFGHMEPHDSAYTGSDGYNFSVGIGCPDAHLIRFDLTCKDASDSTWPSHFYVDVSAPLLTYVSYTVNDAPPGGNGNGMVEPGETVDIEVTLENTGRADALDVQADLGTGDPNVVVNVPHASYGDMSSGSSATSTPPYNISIDAGCPDPHFPLFTLDITASGGYVWADTFAVAVGNVGFFDDMEGDTVDWTHSGANDLWHITQHRHSSPNQSWYCGYEGVWWYRANMNASLVSRPIFVAPQSHLEFDHWYRTEEGYDYGYVEVNDGSGWVLLDAFTGYSNSWEHQAYDLDYPGGGSIQVRFRFFTDGGVGEEGWYVDDVYIWPPVGLEESAEARSTTPETRLGQNSPNPFCRSTTIRYSVASTVGGQPSAVNLSVYDVAGRLVRTLADGEQEPGSYSIAWDGKGSTGRDVAGGVYFYRLTVGDRALSGAEGFTKTKKMTLIR